MSIHVERAPTEGNRRGILMDFDHTLFDTDRFFWVDLKSAFARFGVRDDAWERSYEAIWPSGYSLEKHLDELQRLGVIAEPDTRRTMLGTLEKAFVDLRSYLYPDVPRFLKAARQRKFELILFSFGDSSWQSYKARASGVAALFDEILYTARQGGKAALLDELGAHYAKLLAIDNNPADLDSMKARLPDLQTHLICRVEPSEFKSPDSVARDRFREAARYLGIASCFPHHRCRSLDEVPF